MRAVIYARYSSDQQREASIEDQVAAVPRAGRARRAGQVVEAYADHAMSGASALRPGYQRLLEDVARRPVRCGRGRGAGPAVARPGGRRRPVQAAALRRRAARHLAEGEIGELHVGLKGTMNALFLKDLAAQDPARPARAGSSGALRRRALLRLRRGARSPDRDGVPERGVRRIDAAEAAIVRRIFTEYAAGRSPKAIASG